MVTSTVEKLSPTRVKLHITVTPTSSSRIAHAYEHIAQDIQIPGFRKGKVPAPIIDQRVGRGAVIEHAVSEGLDGFYREAVTANEVRIVGRPSAEVIEWPSDKDFSGDLKVEVEVDVRPEFDLPELTASPSRSTPSRPTTPLDAELDRLRGRFGTLVTVDRPRQGRLRRAEPRRHDRRRRDRPRRGRVLRGRLGRAARGHRRGRRVAHRR
jgi:trigger factor